MTVQARICTVEYLLIFGLDNQRLDSTLIRNGWAWHYQHI
jgi:hypothetical protein